MSANATNNALLRPSSSSASGRGTPFLNYYSQTAACSRVASTLTPQMVTEGGSALRNGEGDAVRQPNNTYHLGLHSAEKGKRTNTPPSPIMHSHLPPSSSTHLPHAPKPTMTTATSAREGLHHSGNVSKNANAAVNTTAESSTTAKQRSVGTNTIEVGGAHCITLVQQSFIYDIWLPSRRVLEASRDRDMWGILKPLEVHLRENVMQRYFFPMRLLLSEEEDRKRNHIAFMEEEKREMLASLETHLRCVALPTFVKLTTSARQIEDVRSEIKGLCKLMR